MKTPLCFLAMMLIVANLNAQYIYNDFDGNQNVPFSGWPNPPTVVANPNSGGINTSANVGKWVRSGEQWAHVFAELSGKIDFTTNKKFYVKVWSPVACNVLFKLEDKANSAVFTEISQPITTPNQWGLLTFNFTSASSATYDKIVLFMDFSATTDHTFYFDDVEGPAIGGGSAGNPVTLPVTFEDPLVNYGLTDFGGTASEIVVDPTNAANKVAKTIKTVSAETWAGTTVGGAVGFPTPIPFAAGSTSMSVKVWSPTAGTPIRLKVEASNDPTKSVETEALTTVASAWQTLIFNFSNQAAGTAAINFGYSYNKASIFFNFGTNGATAGEKTYYWDNMGFGANVGLNSLQADNNIFSTYPNPASSFVNLDFKGTIDGNSQIEIFDLNSKLVKQLLISDKNMKINTADLKPGVYMIRILNSGKYYSNKLIIN